METGNVVSLRGGCEWHSNRICAIGDDKPCSEDCSLRVVPFNSEAIEKQMRFEEAECQRLKRDGMFRNRLEIKDKIGGIFVMQKALKKYFSDGVIEPHIVDKDIEYNLRIPKSIIPTKGWRGGLFR